MNGGWQSERRPSTGRQVRVWYGALGAFPAWVINRATLTLATSQERFPEFGDVYQHCHKMAIQARPIPRCQRDSLRLGPRNLLQQASDRHLVIH